MRCAIGFVLLFSAAQLFPATQTTLGQVGKPALPAPRSCRELTQDEYGNFWSLCGSKLFVLPAQDTHAWKQEDLSRLAPGDWRHLATDDFGFLWIASVNRLQRLDPRFPEKGWADASAYVSEGIASMSTGAAGSLVVKLRNGEFADVDMDRKPVAIRHAGIPNDAKNGPQKWQLVGRLPGANHDLSGDVLNGAFYLAGGQTAEWGYPATRHIYDEVLEIRPGAREQIGVRVVGHLLHPRYYNGTSYLDGKVWVIAGCLRDNDWKAHDLDTVEIWDPVSKKISAGPKLPMALEMVVAQNIAGRIYVAGARIGAAADVPISFYSIGTGETAWRQEPDAPSGRKNIAGLTMGGKLYLLIPNRGLGVFGPITKRWDIVDLPEHPRSSQMGVYRDEIWMMGGQDVGGAAKTLIYKPSTGATRKGPELPRELSWGAGVGLDGRLLVIGGAGGRCYSNRVFALRAAE